MNRSRDRIHLLRRAAITAVALTLLVGSLSACAVVRRRLAARATARALPDLTATVVPGEGPAEIPTGGPEAQIPTVELTGPGAPSPAFGMLPVVARGAGFLSQEDTVALAADSGAEYLRVNLEWAISEPRAGALSFNTDNDRKIELIESAGLRLFPVLTVGKGWMNSDRRGDDSNSYPPDDLSQDWDEQHGYSADYYNFVFQFISHYRGHFDYVVIENEANSAIFWGGTADEYVRLIRTAYKAIKDADPNVRVVDSGFVSNVWGLCMAMDYLSTGVRPRAQVVEMMKAYYSAETSRLRIRSESELDQALNDPRIQEQCRRVNVMLDNMGGSVDAINFHFYEDYRVMHFVTDWIKLRTQRAGYNPGLVTHEIGQRGPDVAFAESEQHAKLVFKKLITAMSLGLEGVVWFSADTVGTRAPSPDKIGLFGEGGTVRPAARTFKLVVETIGEGYRFREARSAGPSLFHYLFENDRQEIRLEALWSESGQQSVALAAPAGASQATITDYAGASETVAASDGSVQVTVDDAPIFVVWR